MCSGESRQLDKEQAGWNGRNFGLVEQVWIRGMDSRAGRKLGLPQNRQGMKQTCIIKWSGAEPVYSGGSRQSE